MLDLSQPKHKAWQVLSRAPARRPGVVLFLGASDTGKTTSLRAAATHLAQTGILPLAVVDADIGQSTIGPPTTVDLTLVTKNNWPMLLNGRLPCHAIRFVGAFSPVGYLLQTIVATKKLVDKAVSRGSKAVLVDTTGLIAQSVGFQLKLNKIQLLEPSYVVALQREWELEALLSALARWPGLTIHRLAVSDHVRTRSPAERYRYRTSCFALYFRDATRVSLETSKLSILSPPTGLSKLTTDTLPAVISPGSFPWQSFAGCLLGLNNARNETLALGLLERVSHRGATISVLTPLRNSARVRIVQMAKHPIGKNGKGTWQTGTASRYCLKLPALARANLSKHVCET